jgi:rRNA maturation protein Nop10
MYELVGAAGVVGMSENVSYCEDLLRVDAPYKFSREVPYKLSRREPYRIEA